MLEKSVSAGLWLRSSGPSNASTSIDTAHALSVLLGASATGIAFALRRTSRQGRRAFDAIDVLATRIRERAPQDGGDVAAMVTRVLRAALGSESDGCQLSYEVSQCQSSTGIRALFHAVVARYDVERSWRYQRYQRLCEQALSGTCELAEPAPPEASGWDACEHYLGRDHSGVGTSQTPQGTTRASSTSGLSVGLDAEAARLVFSIAQVFDLRGREFVFARGPVCHCTACMRNGERGYLSRPMHLVEAVILLGMNRPVPQLLWLLAQATPDAGAPTEPLHRGLLSTAKAPPKWPASRAHEPRDATPNNSEVDHAEEDALLAVAGATSGDVALLLGWPTVHAEADRGVGGSPARGAAKIARGGSGRASDSSRRE